MKIEYGVLMDHPDKIVTPKEFQEEMAQLFEAHTILKRVRDITKLIVVMTSGTFDLPHPDHYRYLRSAKALGDVLVVLLESDESTDRRKSKPNDKRPILPFEVRAQLLSYLPFVHFIIKYDFEDTMEMIHQIQPKVYVQSEATKEMSIAEKSERFDLVERYGGVSVIMPADNSSGLNTSGIVGKIKKS
jgi:cytidyltransferase-like protein